MFLCKYDSDEMQFLAKEITRIRFKLAEQGFPEPYKAMRLSMHPVTKYKLGHNSVICAEGISDFYGVRIIPDTKLPIGEIQILINAEGLLL